MSSLLVNVENPPAGFYEADKKNNKKRSAKEAKVEAIAAENFPKKAKKVVSFSNTVEVVLIPCAQEYEDYEDETCEKGQLPRALWISGDELKEMILDANRRFTKYADDHWLPMTNESLRQFIASEED